MNNVLINLLINIKYTSIAGKEFSYVPYNKLCLKMLNLLYDEGLIQSFKVIDSLSDNPRIKIVLRYNFGKSIVRNLSLISRPSDLRYLKLKDLYKVKEDKKIVVLSTSRGFLTGLNCKRFKIGGKILFTC